MIFLTEYDLGKVVGDDGADGNGIASISKTGTSGLVDTYTITYTDGDTDTFTVTNGEDGATGQTGATGNGISSVTKTGTSGLVDTYTILFTNGNSTTFTVTNGKDGSDASVTIVTSWNSTTSDSKVPSEKLVKTDLDKKIDKSNTSGLVKNDGSIMTSGTGSSNWAVGNHTHSGYVSATKVTSWSSTVSDSNVPSEKLVKNSLDDKIAKSSTSGLVKNDGTIDTNSYLTSSALSNYVQKSNTSGLLKNDGTVDTTSYSTFSGSYSDLSNKPTIPSSSSDLSDGSDLVKKSQTTGLLKNDGSVMSSGTGSSNWAVGNHTHSAYVNPTKVTSWSATVSDDNVASEKLIKDSLDTKQATLVSGTNIKTINNETLLGSGNITIQGGSSVDIVTSWNSTTSDSKVPSEKLTKSSLDDKIAKSNTTGLVKNDGTIDTNSYSTTSHSHDIEDLDASTTFGDLIIEVGADSEYKGIGYANNKLIYNTTQEKVFYDKNGYLDTDSGNELVTMNDIPSLSDYVKSRVGIEATQQNPLDLDDYKTGGFYTANATESSYISHTPTNNRFTLVVERSDNNYVKQTFSDLSTNAIYVRYRTYSGGWGNWEQIATKTYVDTLIGSAITYINGSGS